MVFLLILVPLVGYFLVNSGRVSSPDLGRVVSQESLAPPAPPVPAASPAADIKLGSSEKAEDLVVEASPSATVFDSRKVSFMVTKPGQGKIKTKAGNKLTVNYVGLLLNGTKFDASADHGQPFTFSLGKAEVIKGWDLGLMGMKVGEVRRLIVPSFLAYGDKENGPIPANSPLFFEVELLKIN